MTKRTAIKIGVPMFLLASVAAAYFSVPLRRPDGFLRRDMLRSTPIGMSFSAVEQFVASSKLPVVKSGAADGPDQEQVITAQIGSYSLPIQTAVFCSWHFDAEWKLRGIDIHRERPPQGG